MRPIAYLRQDTSIQPGGTTTDEWRIHEVASGEDTKLFMDLLDASYAAASEVAHTS